MPIASSSPYRHLRASTFVREQLLQGFCGRTINATPPTEMVPEDDTIVSLSGEDCECDEHKHPMYPG